MTAPAVRLGLQQATRLGLAAVTAQLVAQAVEWPGLLSVLGVLFLVGTSAGLVAGSWWAMVGGPVLLWLNLAALQLSGECVACGDSGGEPTTLTSRIIGLAVYTLAAAVAPTFGVLLSKQFATERLVRLLPWWLLVFVFAACAGGLATMLVLRATS